MYEVIIEVLLGYHSRLHGLIFFPFYKEMSLLQKRGSRKRLTVSQMATLTKEKKIVQLGTFIFQSSLLVRMGKTCSSDQADTTLTQHWFNIGSTS